MERVSEERKGVDVVPLTLQGELISTSKYEKQSGLNKKSPQIEEANEEMKRR